MGVIGHLALWFALHVLFGEVARVDVFPFALSLPDPASLRPFAPGPALLCARLLLRRHRLMDAVLVFAAGLSEGAELLRPLPGLTAPQPLPFAAESPHVGTIGERAWHGADD